MSTRTATAEADPIIESRDDLLAIFAKGEKPKDRWRIGTEHEKFVYRTADHRAPSYEEPGGIRDLLGELTAYGWEPVIEGGKVIALSGSDGAISLEPAGQFELSGAPLDNLHETCAETGRHLRQVKEVGEKLGLGFLGMGFWPDKTREELPIMPKGRYAIMLRHMPRVGSLGLDMMLRTCTIQTNLDYASEADMVKKFRVSLALQPLATALFANSPFTESKPNGFLSYRSHIWTDTDPQRTGMLPFVFEDGFGYERYADYMLDVPMYFAYREGKYIDAAGLSFRDFLKGELPVLPGEKPSRSDWNDHLSTAFPEVRLKSFLEMRGADGGPWSRICALPAFWVGLLYDDQALDAAWDEVKHWTVEDHHRIREQVPTLALATRGPRGRSFRELAARVLDIAHGGLSARRRLNAAGDDETGYLAPLREIVASGKTPAEVLLDRYNGAWGGDIGRIYDEMAF
ncbi:glutamate--cysteine ligase [Sphingomonas oligoaromativorans]|uniref:glutamate--cysteine ligase n=1 Tax=Sphingomonas oligoaromativorans TaxID=575322 RepID=UPI00142419BE|nr:glutamate--cysteine ligase [Sphingomonas oligoaromativorans]NIJ34889.1 glutamate--cysteine ligase [Sphingomonas oligoaromativorans]